MAESETRLETLEDEVKVLKGEVKRTLVDLRALLMREDSPLGDGALTRRAATVDQDLDDNEMLRTSRNGVATAPGSRVASTNGTASVPPGNPEPPVREDLAAPSLGLPPDDLPGGPPQSGPGPIPGVPPSAPRVSQPDPLTNVAPVPALRDAESRPGPANTSDGRGPAAKNNSPGAATATGPQSHAPNGLAAVDHLDSETGPGGASHKGRPGSVYDEYRELLEETRQTHSIEDSPVGPPLDINLLSNLVYWTARAKQRVGEDRLKDILQLYVQSGHSRPELQDLLLQVSDMVDTQPVIDSENPQEWVELLFHLHGILTGGFPVIKLPHIRLSVRTDAGGAGINYG